MATPTELYIVRHAIAAERGSEWPDDTKRPLTERGINRFKEVVKGLRRLDITVDEVFTSPLVRARQTPPGSKGKRRSRSSMRWRPATRRRRS